MNPPPQASSSNPVDVYILKLNEAIPCKFDFDVKDSQTIGGSRDSTMAKEDFKLKSDSHGVTLQLISNLDTTQEGRIEMNCKVEDEIFHTTVLYLYVTK